MSQAPKLEENQPFEMKEVTYSTKALEMTMMETPPFSEGEKIDELLKKPTYLVMKHDRRRTLWQYYKNDANHEDTREMLDIIQTVPYLHLLVTTSIDLRALVRTSYDAKEWLAFLATTHIPVFPWEHSTYVRIRQALKSCGIRPKGALAGLIKTKKRSDSFAREKDMDFCPLPFDDFYIDNIDLASKYFHVTPIPHPRTADGFDDKVVSAHRILEQVRAAQPKVDTEELIKDVIYAKATMGRRDHMCQALIASNRRAFEIGWAGALEHLGLLDPNKKDTRAATAQPEYAPLPPEYTPPPALSTDLDRDFAHIHDPYHMIRLLQGYSFTEIEHLLSLHANADPYRPAVEKVLHIEARESYDRPLQL
ncbi:hypothetical protein AALT_g8421 [Alternaria alternata]|nr:hypothetical protein AALT_g8421 [Alternaria alternata]